MSKKMSINRKNMVQNNISSQQQINNAYHGEDPKTVNMKSQQKVNKRTSSMKDNSK